MSDRQIPLEATTDWEMQCKRKHEYATRFPEVSVKTGRASVKASVDPFGHVNIRARGLRGAKIIGRNGVFVEVCGDDWVIEMSKDGFQFLGPILKIQDFLLDLSHWPRLPEDDGSQADEV